jgi:hypothetical protein
MVYLRLTLTTIAILSAGCSGGPRHFPTAPTASTSAVAPAPTPGFEPNVAPPFPSVSKPARIYVAANESRHVGYHGGALQSRYVLYDDRAFTLQYASARFGHFEYRGTYTESSGEVVFQWEGSSTAGPWGATGVLTEVSLTVSYNLIMQMTDFEDGVFLRARD